jgi:tRNA(Arg) A34 adenosine deaminase TadA
VHSALPDPVVTRVLEAAWTSFIAGNHGIGAVLVDQGDAIVAVGHNRIFDAAGTGEVLSGTLLAHAEVNALHCLGKSRAPDLTLVSSLAPCPLCVAASTVYRVDAIRYLGHDPSCDDAMSLGSWAMPGMTHEHIVEWSLWCEVLPLVSALQRYGHDSVLVRSYRRARPELVARATDLAACCPLNGAGIREVTRSAVYDRFVGIFRGISASHQT